MPDPQALPVEVLRSDTIAAPHGFLGRRGGLSEGIHAGLNVGTGSDDDPGVIQRNRARAVDAIMPGAALVTVYQVHSAIAVTAREPWAHDARPEADALVTDRRGLLLGILTADCAPVLLCDPVAGVIGAAHAGWRGAIAGVTDNTITAMEALGADRANIAAVVGPCIAQASYEVDGDFEANFVAAEAWNARFFRACRDGHALFDLESYVAARLEAAGIGRVERLGEDTYSQQDRFFSFRRTNHAGESGYGRQISLIGLAP